MPLMILGLDSGLHMIENNPWLEQKGGAR